MAFFDHKTLNKRQYLEGVTVFSVDDDAAEAFLIEEGEVQIYKENNGQRYDIATLGVGKIFGEMALIGNRKHTSFAVAMKRTQLVVITDKILMEKLENTDPLIQGIVHMCIRRLYQSNDEKQGKVA